MQSTILSFRNIPNSALELDRNTSVAKQISSDETTKKPLTADKLMPQITKAIDNLAYNGRAIQTIQEYNEANERLRKAKQLSEAVRARASLRMRRDGLPSDPVIKIRKLLMTQASEGNLGAALALAKHYSHYNAFIQERRFLQNKMLASSDFPFKSEAQNLLADAYK